MRHGLRQLLLSRGEWRERFRQFHIASCCKPVWATNWISRALDRRYDTINVCTCWKKYWNFRWPILEQRSRPRLWLMVALEWTEAVEEITCVVNVCSCTPFFVPSIVLLNGIAWKSVLSRFVFDIFARWVKWHILIPAWSEHAINDFHWPEPSGGLKGEHMENYQDPAVLFQMGRCSFSILFHPKTSLEITWGKESYGKDGNGKEDQRSMCETSTTCIPSLNFIYHSVVNDIPE